MTDAELANLLGDALKLWGHPARAVATGDGIAIGEVLVRQGAAPTRFFLITPARRRALPSTPALLSALRQALGIEAGTRARVGAVPTVT